ncbi:P-loop containing nucleoside triphosphate hydrolase [Glarea lozoyensis ATCC 20868]|uniref:p-loop containing nucleoside triphosphate hydrolase n=2 Tax=Glarea lozoyensis TaxID=101852 RepID=S3CK94_GLAL2|nr:P-loop containing nucleoside triphosphate hydrolase [Glarea lozoyensis ATCC 20868]EHK98979.1 putative Chromosome-associated kinesin KIF4B [Glarea lozoyensis 74030]EPE25639.1 P-loop containing nucleoside triphosphate hydrolase [Glarea lozoyensis ATCC 20868]
MASSPPESPAGIPSRPASAMMRPPRTTSRMSMTSKAGGGSRASDEDGKTSVKVVVRIRPPLKPSDPGFELIPQRFQRSMVQVTSPTGLAIDSPQGRKHFVFDRVFGEETDQEGIWEYLVESTNAFVQGYNVSMLAYGQSGSGKSYTMGTAGPGEQANMDVMGVIPRAASVLFEKLEGGRASSNRNSGIRTPMRYSMNAASMSKQSEKNWTLKATYVEIYNEQLRDLLLPENTPLGERGQVAIRQHANGHILLTGLHEVEVNSVEDLMNALSIGSSIRQTDATAINAKSSRSHAVFSLNLVQRKSKLQTLQGAEKRFSVPLEAMTGADTMVTIDSKLHFVDLAGSERLKNTGAQGDRAKEGISINAGLASLGKVISQLSSRQAGSHVSYRDSKLTRLLQDSLGGNAITYMIACVTPAEFHLSETLNTVQYAQRARAIQSRPRIQQVSDNDGDKQALIDRLKAEVDFLREQIRSTERSSDRRPTAAERPERQNEREMELQNQLLDTQENYTTLSQRHAKLISEMAKARDGEIADNQNFEDTLGDSATERLKRSNSFAEAVEQVVLEYEKTIQTLEQSLSSTRSSLSNTETILLEKETKCAYVETVNSQLQARLQKLIDRETSTENYLHDLEAKLDGHTSGEEKNSAIIMELRKEIARVRENEASCEDYISTLEERLAEADQDAELMQREIDRLEHVVERQRSLGKLDNLLYELDHIQQDGKVDEVETATTNGAGRRSSIDHSRQQSFASRRSNKDMILEEEEAENTQRSATEGPVDNGEPIDIEVDVRELADKSSEMNYPPQSPAQSKFVEDKLENVTQELFDLKVEHESTVDDFNLLQAKYAEALHTLAELQDAVDEARHPVTNRDSVLSLSSPNMKMRPASFLADARVEELRDGGHFSSSRSLSSELSSVGELPSTLETSKTDTSKIAEMKASGEDSSKDAAIAAELDTLRALAADTEAAQSKLAEKYAQLEEEHLVALDLVEELKTDLSKAKANEISSPRASTPVIRRKSSQNVMIIDKAHRAFASLRNIATENFDASPDIMANFELNLNTAMHELHSRSERVQELEADITAVRKEMETKMTIISGLTRERSSMKSSPMDMSVVSSMRDQLLQIQNEMRVVQEKHASREKELQAEVDSLRTTLDQHSTDADKGKVLAAQQQSSKDIQDKKIVNLEAELSGWETRHQSALASMGGSEKQLLTTITQLEQQLSAVKNDHKQHQQQMAGDQEGLVVNMQNEIEEHKASIAAHSARVAELEHAHTELRAQLQEATSSREIALLEKEKHASLLARLEQQISEHEQVVKTHQDGLAVLHANHTKEIDTLRATIEEDHQSRSADLSAQHQQALSTMQTELAEARDDLTKIATQIAFALGLDVSTGKLEERIADLLSDQKVLADEQQRCAELESHVTALTGANDTVVKELQTVKSELAGLLAQSEEGTKLRADHASVSDQLMALKKEMTMLTHKNRKNSRLVEELEEQLASNFDQHQMANNRLSTLQTERNAQIEEANASAARAQSELEAIKEEYASLQAKMVESSQESYTGPQRTNSNSGNTHLRKSASVASLPSPPPAIPLPPLPGSIAGAVSPSGNAASVPIPQTPTQGNRPSSKDLAIAQIQEDQEARIRTIEKHLFAEKQLTTTLEEALTDLERQSNKVKADCDAWRRRANELEAELRDANDKIKNGDNEKENRWSMLQVEEERKKRRDAEIARAHLEERMNAISKKKKKGSLNCF